MKKYLTLIASFVIMLCIGSVYAWSIIASELINNYNFSAFQTQTVFGVLIALFPATMIFTGHIGNRIKHNYLGYISGVLFFSGYFMAGVSNGNFFWILLGIGILGGIATGFGYWVSLTSPVLWFPQKKGLVTGIAAAGFGLGAVFLSKLAEIALAEKQSIFIFLSVIGIFYGLVIVLSSSFISQNESSKEPHPAFTDMKSLLKNKVFRKLFVGIFLGTFAGLLVIGNLKMIGSQANISNHTLVLGVSLFAIANFTGRIFWGFLSDKLGAVTCIVLSLSLQSLSIISLEIFSLSGSTYLLLSALVGFGFGGNFVLFAKETAHTFGLNLLGKIYPYVFIGYAFAGILGPITGGFLFDQFETYYYPIILASVMSLLGGLIFLKSPVKFKYNAISQARG